MRVKGGVINCKWMEKTKLAVEMWKIFGGKLWTTLASDA